MSEGWRGSYVEVDGLRVGPEMVRDYQARIRELEQRLDTADEAVNTLRLSFDEAGEVLVRFKARAEVAEARADAAEVRVKVLKDQLAGARMTIAEWRAAAQGPKLIAEAEAAYKDGTSEGPDDDVLDHAAEESHPPIQPGAKCSNGDEFWCSLHCPLANAPDWPGGKNCGDERPRCSEHCAT